MSVVPWLELRETAVLPKFSGEKWTLYSFSNKKEILSNFCSEPKSIDFWEVKSSWKNYIGPTVLRSSRTCLRNGIGVSGSLRLTACGLWFVILNFLGHRKKYSVKFQWPNNTPSTLFPPFCFPLSLSAYVSYPQFHLGFLPIHSYKKLLDLYILSCQWLTQLMISSTKMLMSNIYNSRGNPVEVCLYS